MYLDYHIPYILACLCFSQCTLLICWVSEWVSLPCFIMHIGDNFICPAARIILKTHAWNRHSHTHTHLHPPHTQHVRNPHTYRANKILMKLRARSRFSFSFTATATARNDLRPFIIITASRKILCCLRGKASVAVAVAAVATKLWHKRQAISCRRGPPISSPPPPDRVCVRLH